MDWLAASRGSRGQTEGHHHWRHTIEAYKRSSPEGQRDTQLDCGIILSTKGTLIQTFQ